MEGTLKRHSEDGISLLEVMIAALVLTTALLSIAMTMVQGVSATYHAQEQLIAKQKAREALESVFTARSTQNVTWAQVRNVGDEGIFVSGFQPIREMGIDGIANTNDDSGEDIETLTYPGGDGELGTEDDQTRALTSFQRSITINDLNVGDDVDPDIRLITVEVRFQARGVWHSVRVSSYISRFA
jgi:type II secretory pathway pseudopilin PulG